MFALLLSKSDLKDFISSMRTAFGKLQKQLHTISATDIMSIMGYDANWTNLAIIYILPETLTSGFFIKTPAWKGLGTVNIKSYILCS